MKTSQDLISSLRGAAFRWVNCDGRSWRVREIHTLGGRPRPSRPVPGYLAVELARRDRFSTGR